MKTQITKQNAVIILENLIRQQRLANHISELASVIVNDWNVDFHKMMVALFNFPEEDDNTTDPYWDFWGSAVNSKSTDFGLLAEKFYNKCTKAILKEEKKAKQPGVISLLKGHNYRIKGEFGLNT